jgi:hypothetical protein
MIVKRYLPIAVAIAFGLLLLLGLLLPVPALASLLLNWAGFLAAVALILGILNLFAVHLGRLMSGRNLYSGVLILSMVAVFGAAISDTLDLTEGAVTTAFNWVQAPLEAALASLMAFFLLLAGFRLLQRRRNVWSLLFLLTAIIMLLSDALVTSSLLPTEAITLLEDLRNTISDIFVTAGMRGILIGVALGTVTLSLRLLVGIERPYSQ